MNRVSIPQGIMALFLISLIFLLSGCNEKPQPESFYLEGKTMGTTYHIKFYDEQPQRDVVVLKEEVDGFMPGGGKTDVGARDQLVTVRNNLASMYKQALDVVNDPAAAANKNEFEKKEQLLASVENLLAETTAAIAIYDRFLTSDPIADAVKDRSVTSTLKRANDGDD